MLNICETHMFYISCKNTVIRLITFVVCHILLSKNLSVEPPEDNISDTRTFSSDKSLYLNE